MLLEIDLQKPGCSLEMFFYMFLESLQLVDFIVSLGDEYHSFMVLFIPESFWSLTYKIAGGILWMCVKVILMKPEMD